MRIVHHLRSLSRDSGGPALTVPSLCHALNREGVDTALITDDQPDFEPFDKPSGGADVAHDHGIWLRSNHRFVRTSHRHGARVVISPRGMLEPWALAHRRWRKQAAWWAYQKRDIRTAAVLHATAEQEAANIRRLGLRQAIAVIPNAVEVPPCANQSPRAAAGVRTCLFLSRIHPVKGLLNLVNAWSRIRPRDWRVAIAGPDEDGHEVTVRSAVQAARLEHAFEFVGPAYGDKKWELLRQADLFVLPTFSENFGVVVAEALACGVPVITTKGAPWELIGQRTCGWWIDVGVEPLARAIEAATKASDAERRAMGERGKALVDERFTWPPVAQQMKQVYQWVLGMGSKPDCVI